MIKQRKENKLSTNFGEVLYKITNKYGNEVTVTSSEGVKYKRNVTEVKKYQTGSEELDQQDTSRDDVAYSSANSETSEIPLSPTRERKPPEYLNDYELNSVIL